MLQRFSHTAIVVKDLGATVALWSDDFGMRSSRGLRIFTDNALRQFMFDQGSGGSFAILEPTALDSPVGRVLASGRGLWHVALHVSALDDAVARVRERGLWVQVMPSVGGTPYGWIPPASACGAWIGLIPPRPPAATDARAAEHQTILLDHVGHIVDDRDEALSLYGDVLGFTKLDEAPVRWTAEAVDVIRMSAPEGPRLHVIDVLDDTSVLGRLRSRAGQGLAYLAFTCSDLDGMIAHLTARGYLLQVRPADDVLPRRAWIDPEYVGNYTMGSLGTTVLLMDGGEALS